MQEFFPQGGRGDLHLWNPPIFLLANWYMWNMHEINNCAHFSPAGPATHMIQSCEHACSPYGIMMNRAVWVGAISQFAGSPPKKARSGVAFVPSNKKNRQGGFPQNTKSTKKHCEKNLVGLKAPTAPKALSTLRLVLEFWNQWENFRENRPIKFPKRRKKLRFIWHLWTWNLELRVIHHHTSGAGLGNKKTTARHPSVVPKHRKLGNLKGF